MKLKIEGKLRDGFFEWFTEEHGMNMPYHIEFWEGLPQSAQFGLLQEYADTLGIYIKASKSLDGYSCQATRTLKHFQSFRSATLPEAQSAAIAQLNKIINDDLDKMSVEDRANELMKKFQSISGHVHYSKDYALICIDEMDKYRRELQKQYQEDYHYLHGTEDYLEQLKQEIEKL